jgi:arylsulfatase A-like enzyme
MQSNTPNIIIIMLDQAAAPFEWENDVIKEYRNKHMPNMQYIRENSIDLRHHYIKSGACIPSRATLFTGNSSKKTKVHHTDGVAKSVNEVTWINPDETPTLGNILINSGRYNRNDIVYIGKHHLKDGILLDNEGMRIETIDRSGRLIPENLEKYKSADMLADLGFTYLSGPDPHGPSMLNAGFLVDTGYVDIAIDWLQKQEVNTDPFVQIISLIEPHDLVYVPYVWASWGNRIPLDKKIKLEDIPLSPSDKSDLNKYPQAYQNWVKRYDKYFTEQDPRVYRQFYYYLQTLADDNLGRFFEYFKKSPHADNTIIIFTSDHGDLCGTHAGGYQKWYSSFEEVTKVFCNFMRFKNGIPLWKGSLDYLTSHEDIVPTICKLLGIKHDNFTGSNLLSADRKSKAVTCHIQDHITMGNNLTRYPVRMFPLLAKEMNARFIPVDKDEDGTVSTPEYAVSIVWKFIDDILYKLSIHHTPNNYDHRELLDDNVVKEYIDKNLVLLYDLTNDPCECNNIICNSGLEAVINELCYEFVQESLV